MVSIVIPTLNEEKYLPRLLKCIKEQSFTDFEVIIADANSTDSTIQIAQDFGALVVGGGIPAIGRNKGAGAAKGDILIFIDADAMFGSEFIQQILGEFSNRNLDFAIPIFNPEHPRLKYKFFLMWANSYKKMMQNSYFPDGTGQLVICKTAAFKDIGMYLDMQVAEDNNLFWRAAKSKKYKVGIVNFRFTSSTRRLEKIGLRRTFFLWSLIFWAMLFGVIRYAKVQNYFIKMYGGYKGW